MKRKQDTSFRVEAATELMPFLLSKLGGMTRTSVKQLLSQRRVTVNAGIQTRHDTPLKAGDKVQVLQGRGNVELRHYRWPDRKVPQKYVDFGRKHAL